MEDRQMAAVNFEALSKKSFEIKFELTGTNYEAIENIGTGAYGVVCSAVNLLRPGDRVAIKKIPDIFGQTTVAMRTYREIKILKHFRHDNIIAIREILKPKDDQISTYRDVYIVLDLMESDLHRIIHSKQELSDEHVRYFLYQILRGLKYIHSANVVHRDLKPSNLLVNENCLLKIGDFGMARGILSSSDENNIKMTQYVATRWYRAPELMLLPLNYTASIDVWSVGCILAEMLGRKHLFPGREYKHQLQLIFNIVGSPTEDYINQTSDIIREFLRIREKFMPFVASVAVHHLQRCQAVLSFLCADVCPPCPEYPKKAPADLAQVYPSASPKALRLLARMLKLDPDARISVEDALRDPYLSKYHDVDDEPVCIPAFDFSFEKAKLDSGALRVAITKEIMDYHQPKTSLLEYALRPVPRDELEQSGILQPSLSSSSSTSHMTTDEATPISILETTAINSNSNETDALAVETKHCGADNVDMISATPKRSSLVDTDTVMLSAKAVNFEENNLEKLEGYDGKPEDKLQFETGVVQSTQGQPSVVDNDQSSVTDAKALIKAALLNSERRKQQMELSRIKPTVKATTALQRQKEREEKRRQKLEKAQEKKKKKTQQKNIIPKSPLLTDEDRSLLMRWQSMARNTRTPSSISSDDSSWSTSAYSTKLDAITGSSSNSNSPTFCFGKEPAQDRVQPANDQLVVNSSTEGYFKPQIGSWLTASVGNGGQLTEPVISLDASQISHFGSSVTFQGIPYASVAPPPPAPYMPVVPPPVAPVMPSTDRTKQRDISDLVGRSSGQFNGMNNAGYYSRQTFGTHSADRLLRPESVDQSRSDRTGSSSDDRASVAVEVDGSVRVIPFGQLSRVLAQPSVVFPDQAKHSTEQHDSLTARLDASPAIDYSSSYPLVVARGQTGGDEFPRLTIGSQRIGDSADVLTNVHLSTGKENYLGGNFGNDHRLTSSSFNNNQSDGMMNIQQLSVTSFDTNTISSPKTPPVDSLQIITSRLTKSHVDDLFLKHTPRGTGIGYGVGDSFDSCNLLFSASCLDQRGYIDNPDSAPLSATLMADWRDVTGDLDASEFEAVLQEMNSTRINLNDLNSLS